MTQPQTVTPDELVDIAYDTGAVIQRDPQTERLTLTVDGVRYVADGGAA